MCTNAMDAQVSTGGDTPLILGGHSFFSELSNDPLPDREATLEIVNTCMDSGITWFDTTHQPERLALGAALSSLGRRREATIFAWNFMQELRPGDKLDRPVEYQPQHLDQLLNELQTETIDGLVLHDLDGGTVEQHERQEALAREWLQQGHVKTLGVWDPDERVCERYGGDSAFTFAICPYNVAARRAASTFARTKPLGWRNYACSPFVRGWELDKLIEKALPLQQRGEPAVRAELADLLLRYSLFHPGVDRLIIAIRQTKWIQSNVESSRRGPLSEEELGRLRSIVDDI